ncbi:MAG: ribonuclease III [Clostridia bacterium]|nr:ribonuclease III [Clostridia bacterium]
MPDFQYPSPGLEAVRANAIGVLELAYIGDSVFDVYVRGCLTVRGLRAHDMHRAATAQVNAAAQARALERLSPRLTEEEAAVVRRGKNAHAHHQAPKGASPGEYARATGFEALIGYLYLIGRFERLNELLSTIWEEPSDV